MADKKKQPKQDKGALSAPQLAQGLREALAQRAKLVFQHQVTPLKNPMELREVRREIARLKTQIRTQEAAK